MPRVPPVMWKSLSAISTSYGATDCRPPGVSPVPPARTSIVYPVDVDPVLSTELPVILIREQPEMIRTKEGPKDRPPPPIVQPVMVTSVHQSSRWKGSFAYPAVTVQSR